VLVVAFPKIPPPGRLWKRLTYGCSEWANRSRSLARPSRFGRPLGPGVVGALVGVPFDKEKARDITLRPLNPYFALARAMAAAANGTVPDGSDS